MGAGTVNLQRRFPSGGLYFEVVNVGTAAATSVDAELGFTSGLRTIENLSWGQVGTPTLSTFAAVTWSNAAVGNLINGIRYPGHALVTISGISTTAAIKNFHLILWGKV